MKISSIFTATLAGFIASTSADRLRGSKMSERELQNSFECTVKLLHGMSPPGEDEMPPMYVCEEAQKDDITYELVGDVESFFEGEDVVSGMVKINVPYSAVGQDYQINFDKDTTEQISVSYDGRRKLTRSTGNIEMLVVRVSDDNSNDPARKVSQTETRMYWDVFGDENNLRKVYKNCSGGQLSIKPAKGSGVTKGVITVTPRANVCDVSYLVIANEARQKIDKLGISRTNIMFVMPKCLKWGGGAAWGDVNGPHTYFPTQNASFPMTQVHEFGHNLGFRHSAKNGSSYGDDTCYMGNKVPWTDEGAKMCFNAAKLWYTGWFSDLHYTSKPENYAFSSSLIGINESNNRKFLVNDEKTIVRFESDGNNRNPPLFMVYNHKIGANKQVVGDKNKVVITEQSGMGGQSEWKAALGVGQTYRKTGWGENKDKVLVIQNCGSHSASWSIPKRLAKVDVIAYVEGQTYASCSEEDDGTDDHFDDGMNDDNGWGGGKPVCTDYPGFYDYYGTDYNCAWYAQATYLCENYGSGPKNHKGQTANEACCTCGGGTLSIVESIEENSIDEAVEKGSYALQSDGCKNAEGWHDSNGETFNCDWYAQDSDRCDIIGLFFENFGMTAQEACCACKI